MYVKKKHTKETAEWDSYPEWDSLIKIFIDYSKKHSIFVQFSLIFSPNLKIFGCFSTQFIFFDPFLPQFFLFLALFYPNFFVFDPFLPQFFCFNSC